MFKFLSLTSGQKYQYRKKKRRKKEEKKCDV